MFDLILAIISNVILTYNDLLILDMFTYKKRNAVTNFVRNFYKDFVLLSSLLRTPLPGNVSLI